MSTINEDHPSGAAPARAERAAAEPFDSAFWRDLVESASDIMYRAGPDGNFTYANPAAVRITGYTAEQLVGMHFTDLVRDDFREFLTAQYGRQIEEGVENTYYEFPIRTARGEEVWIGQNVQLIREEGVVAGVQAIARDITEQRSVEEALRDSQERFRLVVESLGEGLLITDLNEIVVYANSRVAEITGYHPEELVGRVASEVLLPEGEAREQARTETRSRADGRQSRYELETVAKDGTRIWLETHGVPYRDGGGSVVGTIGLIQEVGERRRAEAALRESEERFRLAARATRDVVYDFDILLDRIIWNEAMFERLGHPADETTATLEWWDAQVHPEDRARVVESLERALSADDVLWSEEYRFRRAEGSYAVVLDRGYIVRGPDGPTRMIGSMTDLTEQHLAEQALERRERYFRSLIENALDITHVLNADRTTRYISPSVTRVLGYSVEELLGRDAGELMHPDDLPLVVATLRGLRATTRSSFAEVRIRHRDGSWRIFETVLRNLLDDPAVEGVVINSRDVTERRQAEEENQRLAALTRENPNPVLLCDSSGRPIRVNPAADRVSRELNLDGVEALLPRNHRELIRASLQSDESFQHMEVVIGERIFTWTYRPDTDARLVYLFAADITGRRLMEEQLRHDALHDALTGLPNRLLFMERLAHAILRSKRRDGYLFAVLFLDLDRFKVINDSLGHHVGDELLILVAQRLQRCLRTEDTVARFGGDEFAILLEEITGISDATRVAERIQAELSAPVGLSGFEVFTSASVGIALSSSAYERPEYLLRNADMAMYRAKSGGHARFEVFDRAMHAHALARLQLETDLRRALERQEFLLYYQPIIDLGRGQVCGAEALIRWRHPDRGMMSPDDFIPIAEETGLILQIGRWVLDAACRQAAIWRERFGDELMTSMAVNLSAKQFSQPDLVDQISHALTQSGLPARALQLELTESAVMENADAAVILLGRLKSLGARLSMDDFGTGYSSLSYLHRFPLDSLKIDRSFVGRLDSEPRTAQLVQTVLTLARSLGVSAVAEGVETPEHLAQLRSLQCELAQGYHFAKPLPAEEMERLLASDQRW